MQTRWQKSGGDILNTQRNNEKLNRFLHLASHILFASWLITEVVYEHTAVSRLALIAFGVCTILLCIFERRFRFSIWMGLYGLFILIGAAVSIFADYPATSWKILATVILNGAFLILFFQYVLLEEKPERCADAFLAGAFLTVLLIGILCYPLDFNIRRFGQIRDAEDPLLMINIVNPNLIGTIAAFSLAIVFSRLLNRKNWIWSVPGLFFLVTILMTKSLKAYAATLFLLIAILLIRFPKYWPVKLLLLVLGSMVIYFKIIPLFPKLNQTFFYNMRATLSYILYRDTTKMSINSRTELAAVGWNVIKNHPITGIGLGGFQFLEGADGTYSHNNFIELLVSGGVFLTAAYYSIFGYSITYSVKRRKQVDAFVHALILINSVQVLLDIGMVSYVDRTVLIWPIWLIAAARKRTSGEQDGKNGYEILMNPCALVRHASNRGMLKWMPDRMYLRLLYRGIMGRKLHLNPPVTMTEKQQWMKLYDHNPLYPTLADKIQARRYVADKLGEQYLIPEIGIWDSVSKIDFDRLPERFVLKCTHDSGSAVVCSDKSGFDISECRRKLEKHMQNNYYWSGREWPYKDLRHAILGETFIGNENGEVPPDYKFFCFDGEPKALLICANRSEKHADYYFYDMNFRPLPINIDTVRDQDSLTTEKPEQFDEMIRIAKTLSEGLPFVRVDLYNQSGKVYFGELTLFDQSGFASDYVGEGDRLMGSFLHIGGNCA